MKQKRKWLSLMIRILASIVLLALLFFLVPWEEMWRHVRSLTPVTVILSVACVVAAVALCVWKWGLLLKGLGVAASWRTLWGLYWGGYFLNQFAPGGLGADGYRIYQMGQAGFSEPAAYSVVLERVLAMVSLGICGAAGYLLCSSKIGGLLPLMIGVTAFGMLLFVLLLVVEVKLPGKGKLITKTSAWLKQFSASRLIIRQHPGYILGSFAVTVLFHMANFLLVFVLLSALQPDATFIKTWLLNAAVSVLSMIPLSINGLGIREFAYLWVGGPLGFESSALVASSLLFAFFVAVTTLYGGVEILLSRKNDKDVF